MVGMRPRDDTPEFRVADLAARRYGVVTRAEMRLAGLTDAAMARRIAAGRLHRVQPGVYAVGHTAISLHGRWLAAVLACGEGALLSHRSAAALWGMLPTSAPRIDVLVPRSSGRRSTAAIRVRRGEREGVVHLGVPVTSPRCTLDDLAAPAWQMGRAMEVAERLGVDVQPEGPRSALEETFLELCGADPPAVNGVVEGLEVDFHWPDLKLVVETDGHEHHRTGFAFERDRTRDQALVVAGSTVLRFTYGQVLSDPESVRAALVSVRSRLLATPGSR
jgi:hypothetical protein